MRALARGRSSHAKKCPHTAKPQINVKNGFLKIKRRNQAHTNSRSVVRLRLHLQILCLPEKTSAESIILISASHRNLGVAFQDTPLISFAEIAFHSCIQSNRKICGKFFIRNALQPDFRHDDAAQSVDGLRHEIQTAPPVKSQVFEPSPLA